MDEVGQTIITLFQKLGFYVEYSVEQHRELIIEIHKHQVHAFMNKRVEISFLKDANLKLHTASLHPKHREPDSTIDLSHPNSIKDLVTAICKRLHHYDNQTEEVLVILESL